MGGKISHCTRTHETCIKITAVLPTPVIYHIQKDLRAASEKFHCVGVVGSSTQSRDIAHDHPHDHPHDQAM